MFFGIFRIRSQSLRASRRASIVVALRLRSSLNPTLLTLRWFGRPLAYDRHLGDSGHGDPRRR
jgi:hypothetical protein